MPAPSCRSHRISNLRAATRSQNAANRRVYRNNRTKLADLLPPLAERHVALVVDTAGFGNQAATVAAAAADLVLLAVAPGEADVIEAQRTVTFVAGLARSTRRTIPVRVIVNRVRRNTTLARHVAAETRRHDQRGRRLWRVELPRRTAGERRGGR